MGKKVGRVGYLNMNDTAKIIKKLKQNTKVNKILKFNQGAATDGTWYRVGLQ